MKSERSWLGRAEIIRDVLISLSPAATSCSKGAPGPWQDALEPPPRRGASRLDFSLRPVHARPDADRHRRHEHLRRAPTASDASLPARGRSSPGWSWPTRSTGRRRRPSRPLLEAMEEGASDGRQRPSHAAGAFFVLATQNPLERKGTYPLPGGPARTASSSRSSVGYPFGRGSAPDRASRRPAPAPPRPRAIAGRGQRELMPRLRRQVPCASCRIASYVREATRPGSSWRPAAQPEAPRLVKQFLAFGVSPRGAPVARPGRQSPGAARAALQRRLPGYPRGSRRRRYGTG